LIIKKKSLESASLLQIKQDNKEENKDEEKATVYSELP
jgi:hypothetical protein